MKKSKTLTDIAHQLLKLYVTKDSTVIDATVGNGYDTQFLCEHAKFVYGFDIQEQAILETTCRLISFDNYQLILDSHLNIKNYIQKFEGIIFNLGYLPGGDKTITTQASETIDMLHILKCFSHHFFVLMMVYPGHDEGQKESDAIIHWLNMHAIKYIKVSLENTLKVAPYILLFEFDGTVKK